MTLIYDDFSGDDLDPMWTADTGGADPTMEHPGVSATFTACGRVWTAAPAGDFTFELEVTADSGGSMRGIAFFDDSGNGVGVCTYHAPVGMLLCGISAYFYSGSFINADASLSAYVTRFRLIKRGENYTAQYSMDHGDTWSTESAAFTSSVTPTKIGWMDWLNGGSITIGEIEEKPPAAYVTAVAADDPIAYYRLGDASGPLLDSSGNGRNMTFGGTANFSQPGLCGADDSNTAIDFDGTGHAYAAGASWQDFTTFSVEVIIKPSDVTDDNIIVGRTSFANGPDDTASRGWHLIVKDGALDFGMTMTDGSYIYAGVNVFDNPVVADDDEHHVVATWDGTTARIIVDGETAWENTDLAGKTLNNVFGQAIVISGENGFATLANFKGVLDEVALYDVALTEEQAAAHNAARLGESAPLNIPLGFATEADSVLPATTVAPFTVALGYAEEADEALEPTVFMPVPFSVALGLAQETDTALTVDVDVPSIGETRVRLGKAVEFEDTYQLEPMVQLPSPITFPEEQEVAFPVSARLARTTFQLGMAVEREQVRSLRHQVVLLSGVVVTGQVQTVVLTGPSGAAVGVNTLVLDILEREPMQAPTSILVSVDGAIPNRRVNFVIDGVEVDHQTMPDGTGAALFSVPVPEAQGQRGEHVLSINQSGAVSASGIFSLQYDPDLLPTSIGPDAPPVDIPESHHPSGVRRWVLQDLMPGGLGSYVMPLNPSEMDNPAFERVLTAKHTTAVNEGQFHITEGAVRPLEWSFKGYCPTQEMAETLRAYAELKRRFYVIDHRGRAWVVVVTQGEIVPRLQEQNIYGELTDWVHDYTISAVIFDRAELD